MNYKWKILKIALLVPLGIAALSWLVMSLWNWLMPALFVGVHQIDYLRALGLFVLCRILFGGFRGGTRGGWHAAHHRRRWEKMSQEEREKFEDGIRMFRRDAR